MTGTSKPQKVDITPTPRILRILGEIPFEPWQCLAELIDNSLDAFSEADNKGRSIPDPRIDAFWSSEDTLAKEREIIISDNGPGMELEALRNATKAGYTSNDPIHHLGLFGMGFNIATARLGDETLFLSATKESDTWVGIKIDFEELINKTKFEAPVIDEPKRAKDEHGTKIIIRNLKNGIYSEIRNKKRTILSRLENIYSPTLTNGKINIYVQGKLLTPGRVCIWGKERYVNTQKYDRVYAYEKIDRDLGTAYFDLIRNRYLSDDESADLDIVKSQGKKIPDNIITRQRRLKGWLGIQRYSDPSDFGIDFIRNGRKILISDKRLFGFENPDTGNFIQEYPIELGSTVGGRITGELHVNYLIPTYQKNGFDETDRAWRMTVDTIRGAGPFYPKYRSALEYSGINESPLGKLANAYRRNDPGTKCLAIPPQTARSFYEEFSSGVEEYQSDEVWFQVAKDQDKIRAEKTEKTTPVDTGDKPSDDPDQYVSDDSTDAVSDAPDEAPAETADTSDRDELIQSSVKDDELSLTYEYDRTSRIKLTAWRIRDKQIKVDGNRVPCHLYPDGVEADFFYDPFHPILTDYPLTIRQLLLHLLAERCVLRDPDLSYFKVFLSLLESYMVDERINPQDLQERAVSMFEAIKEKLPEVLGHRFSRVKDLIQEIEADEEGLAKRLIKEAPHLLNEYQESSEGPLEVFLYLGDAVIERIVKAFPEDLMDGKLFRLPYLSITVGKDAMQNRLRSDSVIQIISYLSDIRSIQHGGAKLNKNELMRLSHTLSLLTNILVI